MVSVLLEEQPLEGSAKTLCWQTGKCSEGLGGPSDQPVVRMSIAIKG